MTAILDTTHEQVIRVNGRIIRLIPGNKFGEEDMRKCPVIFVKSDGKGFYRAVPYATITDAFAAYDVTGPWKVRHAVAT